MVIVEKVVIVDVAFCVVERDPDAFGECDAE